MCRKDDVDGDTQTATLHDERRQVERQRDTTCIGVAESYHQPPAGKRQGGYSRNADGKFAGKASNPCGRVDGEGNRPKSPGAPRTKCSDAWQWRASAKIESLHRQTGRSGGQSREWNNKASLATKPSCPVPLPKTSQRMQRDNATAERVDARHQSKLEHCRRRRPNGSPRALHQFELPVRRDRKHVPT